MNSEFFVLAIVADLAAELIGLHGESSFYVGRLCHTHHKSHNEFTKNTT